MYVTSKYISMDTRIVLSGEILCSLLISRISLSREIKREREFVLGLFTLCKQFGGNLCSFICHSHNSLFYELIHDY